MLKSRRSLYSLQTFGFDLLALFVAFVVAWALRDSLAIPLIKVCRWLGFPVAAWVRQINDLPPVYAVLLSTNPLVGFRNYLWLFLLAAPPWIFFLNAQNGYDFQIKRTSRQQFALCAYAGMLGTVALVVLLYLMKFQPSRLLLLNWMLFGIGYLWASRAFLVPLLQRNRPGAARNIIVIGNREATTRFAHILESPAYRGARLLGYVCDFGGHNDNAHLAEKTTSSTRASLKNARQPLAAIHQFRWLGSLGELARVLDDEIVDEVILVRSQTEAGGSPSTWGNTLELCLQRGRTVSLVDDMIPPVGAKIEATTIGSMPTLVMHNTPQNTLGLAIKALMDRVLALIALTILALPFAIIAVLVKLHDGGPVFFAQDRVGLNGRLFNFYKFRSMAVNAQELLEKMKCEEPEKYRAINIMEEPFFKAKDGDDPRITPIGRFIRKYSLDELPQFWNVLKGDMSLVGPRPPLPKEVAELQPWQRRKLSVKGGLTCIWQATGRNDITEVDEWMRLDLEYIDNWSLWLDVKLLFKTVQVLIKPKGAS